jgi:hypothetical protein
MVSTLYAGGTLTILPFSRILPPSGRPSTIVLGGSRAEFAVARHERQLEVSRRGQLALEHGCETVGRHDVKTDSRNGNNAGVPDFLTARVDVFEDRDFAGDVEVVRAGALAPRRASAGWSRRTDPRSATPPTTPCRFVATTAGSSRSNTRDSQLNSSASGRMWRHGGRPELA